MTRKTLLLGAVALAMVLGVRPMQSLATNANCEIVPQAEFDSVLAHLANVPVPPAEDPFTVRLTLDTGFDVPPVAYLRITAGTAPIAAPSYEADEFAGPFQTTLDLVISTKGQVFPMQISPSFLLLLKAERAICNWESEMAVDLDDASRTPHFKLTFLDHRPTDFMVGYTAQRID